MLFNLLVNQKNTKIFLNRTLSIQINSFFIIDINLTVKYAFIRLASQQMQSLI